MLDYILMAAIGFLVGFMACGILIFSEASHAY